MEDRSESAQCCELSALLEVVRLVVEENQTLPPPSSTASLLWPPYEQQASPQPRHSHGTRGAHARRNSHHNSGHSAELDPPTHSHGKASQTQAKVDRSASAASRVIPGGPCYSCGITYAPQWRRPDGGTMLLCNRCGIHYTRYKTLPGPRKESQASKPTPPDSPAPSAQHSASKRKAAPEQLPEDQHTPQEDSCYGVAARASLTRHQPPALSSSAPSPQSTLEVVMLQKVCAKRHPSTAAVGAVAGLLPAARSQSHTGASLVTPTSSDTSHGKDQDGASMAVEQLRAASVSNSASGRRHRSRRHSAASAVQLPAIHAAPYIGDSTMDTESSAARSLSSKAQDAAVQLGPGIVAPVVSSASSSRSQPQLRQARQAHAAPSRLATPSFADEAHGHVPYPSPGLGNARGGAFGLPSSAPDMPGPGLQEQVWPQLQANQSAPIPIPSSSKHLDSCVPAAPFMVVHAVASGSSAEAGAGEPQLYLPRRTSRGPSTANVRILSMPASSIPEMSRSSGSHPVSDQQAAGQQEQGDAETELEVEPAGGSSADPDADADMAMMDM